MMHAHRPGIGMKRWLAWLLLLVFLPACVISGGAAEEEPTPTPTATATTPAETPAPTNTPRPTVTPLAPPTEPGDEGGDQTGEENGGSGEESPTDAEPGGSTNDPGSAPEPATFGTQIYSTNFTSGWPDQTYEGYGTLLVVSGGYEINVSNQGLWTTTTVLSRSEFYAEMDATPQSCVPGQSWYGMVFHWRSNDQFRFFVVTCSGRWALFDRRVGNRATVLGEGEVPANVDPAAGTHKLGVKVQANVVTLWIDDYRLTQAGVSDMPSGDIGPYAETTGTPVTVLFSRLAIFDPGTSE